MNEKIITTSEERLTDHNFFSNPAGRVILALVTCALWGSAFPAIKTGFAMLHIETAGSKILFAGYRFTLAGILTLILVSLLEKEFVKIKVSSVPAVWVQGLLQTTIQYTCFYIGLSYTTGTKGSVINGSNAFFTILAAHFMMHNSSEKITMRKVIGCVIGFAGIIVVNLKDGNLLGDFTLRGEGMVLLCSISYGISSVTLKMFADKEKPNAITAYQLIMGGIMLMILGFATGGSITGFTPASVFLLLYLSMTSSVSFCLWANLLKYNPVGKVAIFGFTIPVFGTLFSSIFLNETIFTFTNMAALVLISIGIIIVNKEPKSGNAQS